MARTNIAQVGDVAQWTGDGGTAVGTVIKVGKSYADVEWNSDYRRVERIRYAAQGRVEFFTLEQVEATARDEDEEQHAVIHHVTRYGNVISCGATGPVRVEYTAMKVTCEACKAADYEHLIDNAHAEALDMDAERDEIAAAHVEALALNAKTDTSQRGRGLAQVDDVAQLTDYDGRIAAVGMVLDVDGALVTVEWNNRRRRISRVHSAGPDLDFYSVAGAERMAYDEIQSRQNQPFIARIRASREANGCGLKESLDAVRAEIEAEAYREDWQRRTVEAAGGTVETHIAKFSGTVVERDAPLCLRMTGAHIQHMTADPTDPTCRDTADLHPVEAARDLAAERARGDLPYMWSDVDWHEGAK